ncbi:hypothetical protein [Roseivirga thermotolerans]|uniref:hypothetical protein n=1 Tax=Roseivirga thermotolerans TaxID=1758176 RepID=UPI00167B24A5|nr:hypothetical protein [Roseivirga thermotolerans]
MIIDTNTFKSVFDVEAQDHDDFAPVYNWIIEGEGKIVFGGTKYKDELRCAYRYLKVFNQFARMRKVITVDDKEVDDYQVKLEEIEKHKDFDDPHLVSICYISKCRIICTNEKRAIPFLARKDFYPKNSPRPKLYTSKRNSDLLCRKNMAEICMPCDKLKKIDYEDLKKTTANIVYKQ